MNMEKSFGYKVNLIARMLKRELDSRLKEYDLTTSQWGLLKILLDEDGVTQVEIAERTHSDKMTTGAVIDKLIRKELVKRERSDVDKRAYKVILLGKGRELGSKLTTEAVQTNEKALSGFTKEEIEQFFKYIDRVNKNLGDEV